MLRRTAAAYLDMPETAFEREVASLRLPMPLLIGGKERWDRRAIDAAIDKFTGERPHNWRREAKFYIDAAAEAGVSIDEYLARTGLR
jgi:hypothetical protein